AKMEQAITLLKDQHGFKRYTETLSTKSRRLKNRRYTVALFGAFSAGKSSFANALAGEKVLPVSPNPTTAAICRICPPDAAHPHKTAAVQLKTEAQMLEDVNKSLAVFGLGCRSFGEALEKIETLHAKETGKANEKVHLSFLRAFAKGFPDFNGRAGQNLNAGMEAFRRFVADETQSCFVESIDLFYDCPFTRLGITLVDTPGA
ncbi:dynamin family protein, partial [Heyndrickxia coagulans]|nr:dynamin family protein [Heyndrickxia coagulans]